MRYEDFSIKIGAAKNGEFPVRVDSPAGESSAAFRRPFDAEELTRFLERLGRAVLTGADRDLPTEVGARLFQALFDSGMLILLERCLGAVHQHAERGLRLELHFDPENPEAAALCNLPWEFLYRSDRREFLGLRRETPVVRYLDVPRPPRSFPLELPLRVLVVGSRPRRTAPLDLDGELERIRAAHGPTVDISVLEGPATPDRLWRRLRAETFHVLHFIGHGDFDPESGEGVLLFEDERHEVLPLPGAVLARTLGEASSLGLVFLNACDSARSSRRGLDPFGGVATALIMGGLPAVVAMQFPISNTAATAFSAAFYSCLAAGDPVDAATVEGRMAIHLQDPRSLEWGTPVLFSRTPGGRVFVLPDAVAVESRETISPPLNPPKGTPPEIERHILDQSRFVSDKTDGFVGREWIFRAVEQFLEQNPRGYFRVYGDPGIGKSALMAELVRRRQYLHHFNVRAEGIVRPEQFLNNICAQLIARKGLEHTSLPSATSRDSTFLNRLLEEVSQKQDAAEKTVLVVDALDEAEASVLAIGANTLYLPITLPPGVYVIVTARRGASTLRAECQQQTLDIEQDSSGNLADIRAFVESRVESAGVRAYLAAQDLGAETFVAELVDKSQGNFMYLRLVTREIEDGGLDGRAFDSLPVGLANYYEDHWSRMKARDEELWFRCQLPVLVALTVVKEPVSLDLIADFSGVGDRRRIRDVLRRWDQFLYSIEVSAEDGTARKRYRLYHGSFHDFIAAKDEITDERVDLAAAHRQVTRSLRDEFSKFI